ncbi:MAG: hypothetical protein FWB92_10605 [Oscillospiraceae bacterium]|nr:hypothetical protein [Oscillospiraceae bacterium]
MKSSKLKMKRKILIILFALMASVVITSACAQNNYETQIAGIENTDITDESVASEADIADLSTLESNHDELIIEKINVSVYANVSEIVSGEAVAIARVFVSEGITYNIEVWTDSGTSIFSGLRKTGEEPEMSGQWFSFAGNYDQMPHYNFVPRSDLSQGYYYLYVGNQGFEILKNVYIRISSPALEASIELVS